MSTPPPTTRPGGTPSTNRAVRVTSSATRVMASSPAEAARTTAELPVVRRDGPGGLPHRGVGPVRVRRFAAPIGLRILVWLLALVFVVAAGGAVVALVRPNALAVLRRVTVPTTSGPTTDATAKTDGVLAAVAFGEVGSSGSTVNYAVPATSYSLVVTTIRRCYTEVASPIGATGFVFAKDVPAGTTATISVRGTSSIVLQGLASSIVVERGSTLIGSIAAPKLGETYTFTPETTS